MPARSPSSSTSPAPASDRVLLLDRDTGAAAELVEALSAAGFEVEWVETAEAAALHLRRERPALWLAAVGLLEGAPVASLDPLEEPPELILLEDFGGAGQHGAALRARAFEVVQRPASPEQVLTACRRALESRALRTENRRLREEIGARYQLGELSSRDERMHGVFETVRSVADSRASILLTGESGTGKTVLARCIHEHSGRAGQPFVVVNCGALPGALLESELFGHARGAFTGAVRDSPGKFEAAAGGTIFLDEVGEASADLQVKLLRVLEDGTFERVGEHTTRKVDVRTIAATNVELLAAVGANRFRADLYYRLNVVGIEVPPLRERVLDVPLLSERFLARAAALHGRPVEGLTPGALTALCAHPWPGNVRELQNAIERAVLLASEPLLDVSDLGFTPSSGPAAAEPASGASPQRWATLPMGPLKKVLEEPERWLILRALRHHGGNRQATARTLGINRTTLFNKMRKYHLGDFPTKISPLDEAPPADLDRAG